MRMTSRLCFLVLLFGLVGCGGKKIVNQDQTLVTAGGTHIISNVQVIRPQIGSDGGGEFVDMTNMPEEEVKAWIEQNPDSTLEIALFFDDFKLELDTQTVSSYGQFSGLKKQMDKRMDEINKFLKGTKRQLNVKDW
jgi:hypothetical protein